MTSTTLREGFKLLFHEMLPPEKEQRLLQYWSMVEETNQTLNLTRVVGDDAITHHFLDALTVVPFMKTDVQLVRALDIGTGLGVPGVVLAIFLPHIEFVLLDALDKRIQFLLRVKQELSLSNIFPVHGRAEFLAHDPSYRERFDFCISRAVTALPALTEMSFPFLKVGGSMLAMKGPHVREEISKGEIASEAVGGSPITVHSVTVPFLAESRCVAVGKKVTITENRYPRKPNRVGSF